MKQANEHKTLTILSAVLIVIIVFTISFFFVFFDRSFYDKSFASNGAYEKIGVDGIRTTADYLIKYLTSEIIEINETSQLKVFSEKEQSHLEDVQARIVFLKYLGLTSLAALIIIFWRIKSKSKQTAHFIRMTKKAFLYSAITVFALIAIIFLMSLSFPAFFEGFHKVLFPAGNYTFPSDSLLITMFPEQFFHDYAMKMLFHSAILSLILLFLSSPSAFAFDNSRGHNMRKP
jgi:integral membrane protein (TIGR01906 family)